MTDAKPFIAPHLKRELSGIALILFAVFLVGALSTYALAEMRTGVNVRDNVGWLGYWLARPLVAFVGWPAAALTPLGPIVHSLRLFGRLESDADRSWMIFFAGAVILLPIAVALGVGAPAAGEMAQSSGLWGGFVAFYLRQLLGGFGAWVLIVLLASALTAITLRWNVVRMIVGRKAEMPAAAIEVAEEEPYSPPKRRRKKDAESLALSLEPPPEEFAAISDDPVAMLQATTSADADAKEDAAIEDHEKRRGKKKKGDAAPPGRDERIAAAIEATELPESSADELPPVDLLNVVAARNAELGRRELDAMGAKLMEALRTFKVEGELIGRTTGPVVTQFEIEPAPGVKVRQIANLSNDLALAMRAASIRIVAPIPGRGAVGVEVRIRSARWSAFESSLTTTTSA